MLLYLCPRVSANNPVNCRDKSNWLDNYTCKEAIKFIIGLRPLSGYKETTRIKYQNNYNNYEIYTTLLLKTKD